MAGGESALSARVQKALDARHIPHRKVWQGAYSGRGISDIIGTLPGGRALYIELKAPGKYSPVEKGLTAHQSRFLIQMERAGAVCIVADSVETVTAIIDALYKETT